MKVKLHVVDIRRSELSTTRVTVPAWELPILQAVHGAVGVTPVEEKIVEAETPEAEAEFMRLTGRYGYGRNKDGSRGALFAEAVYGQHQAGIMNLQRQMDAAVVS